MQFRSRARLENEIHPHPLSTVCRGGVRASSDEPGPETVSQSSRRSGPSSVRGERLIPCGLAEGIGPNSV